MKTFRAIECVDLADYKEKNLLAHNILKKEKDYTSQQYAGEGDLWSVNNKPLLVELSQFSKQLKAGGLNFNDLDISMIKSNGDG